MAAIKKFFEKKKLDMKFKKAGGGVKLSDSTGPVTPKTALHAGATSSSFTRQEPSASAEKAREAALARQQQPIKTPTSFGTSSAAIKAQVKREMEEEAKQKQLAERYSCVPAPDLQLEAAPIAQESVFFTCPIIGPEVLPRAEMEQRIRDFLYSQLEEERALTAALMVHTFNKNKEEVRVCIETLSRYLDNVMQHPEDSKYRRIRLSNAAFKQRVASCEGALELLVAAGFEKQEQDGEHWLVMPEEAAQDTGKLMELREALHNAEPIKPQLDRGVRLFHPSTRASTFDKLPAEFFAVSAEELRREAAERQQAVERLGVLRTKAMRERDEQRQRRKYRYTLLRVRLPPHGLLLQATFRPHEPLSALLDVVRESLVSSWLPFTLQTPGGQNLEQQDDTPLVDLDLVPAALLTLTFDPEVTEQLRRDQGAAADEQLGLRPELMQQLQQL